MDIKLSWPVAKTATEANNLRAETHKSFQGVSFPLHTCAP